MNLLVVQKEERMLQAAHGEGYAAYMKKTPRWLV
jgi:protein-S-isoprenylcysteine O-methyltransferase Ste14